MYQAPYSSSSEQKLTFFNKVYDNFSSKWGDFVDLASCENITDVFHSFLEYTFGNSLLMEKSLVWRERYCNVVMINCGDHRLNLYVTGAGVECIDMDKFEKFVVGAALSGENSFLNNAKIRIDQIKKEAAATKASANITSSPAPVSYLGYSDYSAGATADLVATTVVTGTSTVTDSFPHVLTSAPSPIPVATAAIASVKENLFNEVFESVTKKLQSLYDDDEIDTANRRAIEAIRTLSNMEVGTTVINYESDELSVDQAIAHFSLIDIAKNRGSAITKFSEFSEAEKSVLNGHCR